MSPFTSHPDLDWSDDGVPRSRLYGDVYFSAADGLAESRAVFLAGCGLPEGWRGRRRFTVAELGFGTGLNVLALLDLWRRAGPPAAHLHIFSVEAHLMGGREAARALARWPELADFAAALTTHWPAPAPGIHRIELPQWRAILDVAAMEAAEALGAWDGRADAWFLDGFAPAANPQMWRQEVLDLVAARSAPGARAATFTVAGAVRRGLQSAGFTVEKKPGFGAKRERLEARLPGQAPTEFSPRVAIVGGGVAGASVARGLRALGLEPLVFEAEAPGAGGSGNPAALVTPRLDAGLGPLARLFASALARAGPLYEALPGAVLARGVLQLAARERDLARFETIARSDLFPAGALALLSPSEVSERLGEAAPAALEQKTALVVRPSAPLEAWLGPVQRARVARLEPGPAGWTLLDPEGMRLAQADAVVIAAGIGALDLAPGLPLEPVRGQASWAQGVEAPAATAWGGYVVPLPGGTLFGATHDRGETDARLRAQDHARNLALVEAALPRLAEQLAAAPLEGRAAVRAVTPDRLPLAGPAPRGPAGLYLLTGLGSRGFCLAPLLGEHLAGIIAGAPSPLAAELATLVDPGRFLAREARRSRPGGRRADPRDAQHENST